MATASFPKNFVWGVSTSAYQIEGAHDEDGRGPSIWDTFCRVPGAIHNNDTGDIASDHYHRWNDDLDLLRDLGVNAYRFSIAWPRVLPEGRGRVNAAGLDFYERLVDALLAAGIEPYPTLYHWDLPQALQDQGGWPERDTASAFSDYAAIVAQRLGDRVRRWTTHNEPMVVSVFGHFWGTHAPGVKDPRAALQTAHHLLLSHGLAAQAIRASTAGSVQVGIALNLQPVDPLNDTAEDQAAAVRFDGFVNRWFLDPLFRGAYPEDLLARVGPLAPSIQPGDLQTMRVPLDFLGVNYYSRVLVRHAPEEPILQAAQVEPRDVERSLMWEIYPQGLGRLLDRVAQEYQPREILITENGLPLEDAPKAGGEVDDAPRIDFLRRHLEEVSRALGRGVPVRGYFVWSLLDNFEWALGYRMRFGLVHVDFATQRRTPKASVTWYRKVIEASGGT
jgi:beta-glucosidase